ncbi:MAG: Holliday junction resolvase RuvX [Cyanobacteria bacterium SIG30]|nr:Holliday junction resolvase RuvX [Cyanobacteria bacterium SIG30]
MAKRILGLDIGTKRIGVAITDPLCIFSRELKLVLRKNDKEAQDEIRNLAKENGVETIVAGLPYNTDGSIGFQAQNCIDFMKPLEKEFKIVYCDERYSSSEAEELLRKEGKKYTKDKGLVDLKSACLILEDYLRGL